MRGSYLIVISPVVVCSTEELEFFFDRLGSIYANTIMKMGYTVAK